MGFSKAEMVHRGPAPNRSEKLERRCGLGKLLEQTHRRTDAQTHRRTDRHTQRAKAWVFIFSLCWLFSQFVLLCSVLLPSVYLFFFPRVFSSSPNVSLYIFLFYFLLFIPPNTEISTQEEITWQPQVTHFPKASWNLCIGRNHVKITSSMFSLEVHK